MSKFISYFKVGFTTTVNIILNALTFGRYIWLEGRVKSGFFKNWAMRFGYKPQKFFQPETEEEIIGLIKSYKSLRVFGSGHSFNEGVVSDEVLVSLDKYSGLISLDKVKKQARIKAGTRVRDVVKILLEKGLAFEALPSA